MRRRFSAVLTTYRTETYTGEHAQIEKRFINPCTYGCIRVSKLKVRRKSTFWRTTEVLTINIDEILKFKNVFDTFRSVRLKWKTGLKIKPLIASLCMISDI